MDLTKTIISSIVTSSLVTLIMQTFIKNGIKNYYDKKLVSFKDQISAHAESRRLDFERKIYDFSLYSSKRHDLYPEMYKSIYKINSELKVINQLQRIDPNKVKTKEDIKKYYKDLEINLSEELLRGIEDDWTHWKTNPLQVSDNINLRVKSSLYSKLSYNVKSADDFFMENVLYFSDAVASKVKMILSAMFLYILQKNNSKIVEENIDESKISKDVDLLENMLKQELNIGDYNSDSNKK